MHGHDPSDSPDPPDPPDSPDSPGRAPGRDGPPPARETIRAAMRHRLEEGWHTVAELSATVHASEREVVEHLAHLERSVAAKKTGRFEVRPSVCLGCRFAFEHRARYTRPGRCPACKGNRISYPAFRITATR